MKHWSTLWSDELHRHKPSACWFLLTAVYVGFSPHIVPLTHAQTRMTHSECEFNCSLEIFQQFYKLFTFLISLFLPSPETHRSKWDRFPLRSPWQLERWGHTLSFYLSVASAGSVSVCGSLNGMHKLKSIQIMANVLKTWMNDLRGKANYSTLCCYFP